MNTFNLRTRQELIGNNLMDVCCDYPDQIRVVIDELISHLNDNQLDQIEDLIVNNYAEEKCQTYEELIDSNIKQYPEQPDSFGGQS